MVGKRRKNVLLTHKKRWGIVCYRERWGANVCVPKNIPILFSPPLSPNTALTTNLRFSSYPANPLLIPCAAGSASNSTVGDDAGRKRVGDGQVLEPMGGAGELLFAPAGGEIVRRKYQGYFRGPSPVDSCGGIENCRRGDGGKSWLLCFLIEDHILDFKNAPSFLSSIRMWEISVPICILSALMSFSVGPAEGISALISCSLRLKFSWKVRWAE